MLVYFHGNCQARAISEMISRVYPGWQVRCFEVFGQSIIDEQEEYHRLVRTADVVVSQPIHENYRGRDDLSLGWIRSAVKPGAQIVTFPSMYFGGQLIGYTSLALPSFGMEYHDVLLLEMVSDRIDLGQIQHVLSQDTLFPENFIEAEISFAIEAIVRRERNESIDIELSRFLTNFGYERQLFHTNNHPCRPALAFIANEVLGRLGYPQTVASSGPDFLQFPHIPCSPSVEQYFKKRGSTNHIEEPVTGASFRFPKESMDRAVFVERAFQFLSQYSDEELRIGTAEDRSKAILERLRSAVPDWRCHVTRKDDRPVTSGIDLSTTSPCPPDAVCPHAGPAPKEGTDISLLPRLMGESDGATFSTAQLFSSEVVPSYEFAGIAHGLLCASHAEQKGEISLALSIWAFLRSYEPSHSGAYLREAALLTQLGRLDEVECVLADGLAHCPQDVSITIGFAVVASQRGDLATAAHRWTEAHKRFPSHQVVLSHYTKLLNGAYKNASADELIVSR